MYRISPPHRPHHSAGAARRRCGERLGTRELCENRVLRQITGKQFQTLSGGCTQAMEWLRLFIQTVVVCEKNVKWSKRARQSAVIRGSSIGYVELAPSESQSAVKGV